ncbi:MAG: hypothetical protein RL705_233, partial [Bacteroidota bacterium]
MGIGFYFSQINVETEVKLTVSFTFRKENGIDKFLFSG